MAMANLDMLKPKYTIPCSNYLAGKVEVGPDFVSS